MRRRSSVEGVDTAQEDRSGARGPPCTVLDEEGTLWRESRSSIAGDAVKTMLSHHHRSSGSSSTLLTITSYHFSISIY